MKTKRIMFHLSQELYDLLQAKKNETGVPISEILRRLIKKYFNKDGM